MTNEEYMAVVKDLSTLNMYLNNHPFDEVIDELENKILTNQYRIAVVGDFSTGKSTFINALIGEELLYNSTIEATGVITTVQYGEKPIAQICKRKDNDIADEIIEEIDLLNGEGRSRLNHYLDIRNNNSVDQINIYYPIQGIEKDIVFFDTPGIEKLSKQQVMMTKRIIGEVNAVIFLITKKGFTRPSLKVITGQHEIIGKIPAKDIMVVMTHIGEIYDEKKDVNPELQIEKSVNEAKSILAGNELRNIKVVPLDSRDYLWGINLGCYLREKKNRNEKLKGQLLPQEEYRKRSKFDDFKALLYKFLEEDNIKKSREFDIESTIQFIAEAIEEELRIQNEDGKLKQILMKNQLEKQIAMACENQRRFYNRLIQQLQGHMEDFFESVELDAENEKKQNDSIFHIINERFRTLEDICEENVDFCINATVNDVDEFVKKIEAETNKHLQITSENFIRRCFSEQFQKIFDKEIDVQLQETSYDFSLLLKTEDFDASSVVNDSDVEDIKKEKLEVEQALAHCTKLFEDSNLLASKSEGDFQKKKEELENWYNNELKKLGSRPKAKQKYREETRTKGILFWKKTWTEKVPDGMDYSASIAWDKEQRNLLTRYEQKLDLDALERENANVKKYLGLIEVHKSKINRLNNKIRKYKEYIEEGKRKYTESYISDKKEEVASLCDSIRVDLIVQICEYVRLYLNERKREMEGLIKDELKIQVDKYHNELDAKNQSLSESIRITFETQEVALDNIRKIKEKLSHGKTI